MSVPKKNDAAKSHKADGTPKKRWSSAERAAKGLGPRTRGGQSRNPERRSFTRDGDDRRESRSTDGRSAGPRTWSSDRDDRRSTSDRNDRSGGFRGDSRSGGFKRDDRSGGYSRDDRSGGYSRDDRSGGYSRDDRSGGFKRDDRSGGFRGDSRSGGFKRDDRSGGFSRDDRSGGFKRDDRSGGFRGDSRSGGFKRDDRSGGFSRDDRSGGFKRDDRSGGFKRDDRPGGYSRDDRSGGFKRDDRSGGFKRDDRPGGYSRDDRSGGFKRDDRSGGYNRDNRRDDRGDRGSDRTDRPRRHFVDSGEGRDRRGPARDFHDRTPRKPHREHSDFDGGSPESDQMSWTGSEVVDLQVSEADASSGFAELGVALPIVAALASKGITEPFPIQAATIADAVAGRDVLGRGRTGSGKTLAFGLPMLTRLSTGTAPGSPRALILTPTRELALQIADNLSPLAAAVGLDLTLIAGGMSYGPQIRAFERGVDVLVATPGRLIDLLEQGVADLSQVQVTVLDEADHMSDLGFLPDVQTLLDAVPADGQRLLFSATLDGAVGKIVRKYLTDAVTHEVDSGQASVTTMTHHFLELAPHHKNAITAEVANRDGKSLIFARTQLGADRIAGQLREAGVLAGALHGGLTQGARARVLEAFKSDDVKVLVATDVAARGIHVDDVSLVLQVDPPMGPKDYLHRAGRTARAGESGAVVSIVLPHQRKQVRRIADQAGVRVNPLHVTPGSLELRESTGARPPSETPIAEADYLAIIAPKQQQRRGPKRGGYGGQGGNRGGNRGGSRGGFRSGGRRRDNW